MEINDPKIVALKQAVTAAQQEYDMAITFHEVWRPAAYDTDLHARMGRSYATHAFLVTRLALRHEMLLALLRIWDTNKQAVRMALIEARLHDKDVIQALAVERARQMP